MEIRFNKTGAERKALVTAISEITGWAPVYKGAPGFAYAVNNYIIDRDGTLICDERRHAEDASLLLAALSDRGFVSEDVPETPVIGAADTAEKITDEPCAALSADVGITETPDTIAIELPGDGFSDTAFDNLVKLAAGKAPLIRAALGEYLTDGAEALPIIREDGRVSFPWFRFGMESNEITAWSAFICALCAAAKKQKRVILKEKPLDEGASEKFAMRCFLLKLGFIGDAFKDARRIILAELSGDGSRKMPKDSAVVQDAVVVCGENSGREVAI